MESLLDCEKTDDENSDNDLQIVTGSPKKPRSKPQHVELNPDEKEAIDTIGKELEESIEMKAAKSNLTTINVKSILKQVVTNEHVLALVRKAENPDLETELFEPKFTRAKAKELLSANSTPLPWLTPTRPTSEVHKLITEELDEDSSGDEYVPAEEESEDDRDGSVYSESNRSISPLTPLQIPESPAEINWTDDGVFKIPPAKIPDTSEEANIALRTRSKLSLSATPLEVIEEAFIPPDITTDMYDMDCDDEDWADFLKKFTRPLDEVAKPTEDEEHDPEYNILADENINESDTEELRADKAVKISKKELNELIAELFGAADLQDGYNENNPNNVLVNVSESNIIDDSNLMNPPGFDTASTNEFPRIQPACDAQHNVIMLVDQKWLLEQQMRQHVQMLTQNFLLTYQTPEFHGIAVQVREFLLNLVLLAGSKENSAFKAVNLDGAIKLVDYWEKQFNLNTDEVKTTKMYTCRVQQEAKQAWAAGTEYILTFPPFILETISNSDVFIYPNLLPRIPFKLAKMHALCSPFSPHEEELLAIGLEQFVPYLAEDPKNLTFKGDVKVKLASRMIVKYIMPPLPINKVYMRILNLKNSRIGMNPVKYYFEYDKAPVTTHYVIGLSEYGVVPPCKRSKEVLPIQWRNYVYPETVRQPAAQTITSNTFAKITKPPAFNKYGKKLTPEKHFKSDLKPFGGNLKTKWNRKKTGIFCSTPKAKFRTKKLEEYFKSPKLVGFKRKDCVRCFKFNSSIFQKLRNNTVIVQNSRMLPSMPGLGILNNGNSSDAINLINVGNLVDSVNRNETVEPDSSIVINQGDEVLQENEEINVTVVPSSTKNARKSLSGAEKKKAKLCREYNATLAMLAPEDPRVVQERAQSYAQAYFEKARERLSPQDYDTFMEILNDFNDGTSRVTDLYKQIEALLANKHQDLLDEFVTFLTSSQAKDVGKLILYYKLGNMSLFLHKLEIYFKDQPAHIRKIYRSLTDLSTCVDVTMDRVKNTILPLLKGNNLLVDWFLQIFPNEPPPKSLLNGAWEQLDMKSEFIPDKDLFETVTVPDDEDLYGGPNCICSCHQRENTVFNSRLQHCTPCGLKFVQGRVYVQTDKGLRLSNVSFPGSTNVDHNLRLNCSTVKKGKHRSETSPSKQLTSPVKEAAEEQRHGCDSEDETDTPKKRRATRLPRKRRTKVTDKPEKNKRQLPDLDPPIHNILDVPESTNNGTVNKVRFNDEEIDTTKHTLDEVPEWDCNTSIESIDVKHSPEHSADSGSEFCEESSQDNINTETDDTAEELESVCNSPVHSENSNDAPAEIMWTREEDKIILETFQKKGDKEEAFISIANELAHRTVSDIKDRFNTLLKILQNLISSENSTL